MSAASLATIPVLIVFFIFQKQIIEGIPYDRAKSVRK
jgi:ABC-type glycerol-3-phosphate transport system permease component